MLRSIRRFIMSSSDSNCLFCKIIAGQIPSSKVYESEHSFAFLDINPLSAGHTLVIPKHHAQRTHELPEQSMTDIGTSLHKVATAVTKATGCQDYNILQNNGKIAHQEVMHVHYHIIPKPNQEQGLGVRWPQMDPKPDLNALKEKIASHIA